MNFIGRLADVSPERQVDITETTSSPWAPVPEMQRPHVRGKFLFVDQEKFWIKGVTYGTFRPDASGAQFPAQDVVAEDFQAMAEAGLNAVRVYTAPPLWLMDAAAAVGLRVMVGLPWEQHIAFLDDRVRAARILDDVRRQVRPLANHPAVLCYAVGNEIPASIVRWYGKDRIERFIARLCDAVKSEDPSALVTYVNFPTTEYLDLPFLDFVAFNVYLEEKDRLNAYLARLQNRAGEKPLVMAEIGLDSQRNGPARQAESLDWQIATALEGGCVGAFVFAWTDEWYRGGREITDWDFGLTTRDRKSKQALQSVSARFAHAPFDSNLQWPKISVVVCSYNGSRTIEETLSTLEALDYPDYEIIVVDDGSTDETASIVSGHDVKLIRTKNNGLSVARNLGLEAATGEIIAYLDDDAYPDSHWLYYLASAFMRTNHVGIGGPNIAPPGDGAIADCIANAPGGPIHVLISDEVAEHIPGCNMAYRRDALKAVGGFDPRFHVAGDDVDICWSLQERGWTLGFAPTAVIWHHRRNSIKAYFKQQRGYARAEALLAEKWPSKYNSAGHVMWQGRLYGRGLVENIFKRTRIYYGPWGSAPFQSIYEPTAGVWSSMTLMPEWYFLLSILALLTALGLLWSPLLWLSPLLAGGMLLTLIQATRGSFSARFGSVPRTTLGRVGLRLLVAWLHLLQPAARLIGRVQHGLGPWSVRDVVRVSPLWTAQQLWSERWAAIETRLSQLKSILEKGGAVPTIGGTFDPWDLSIRGGLFGTVRLVAMAEEHGDGRQLLRLRTWPKVPMLALAMLFALVFLTVLAAFDHAWLAVGCLGLMAAVLGFLIYADCVTAVGHWCDAVTRYVQSDPSLHAMDNHRVGGRAGEFYTPPELDVVPQEKT